MANIYQNKYSERKRNEKIKVEDEEFEIECSKYNEIWFDTKYENYQISNNFRVRKLRTYYTDKRGKTKTVKGMIIKNQLTSLGYYLVHINRKLVFLHRIVAETFIPNPENKPEVDHIDRNPLNNNIDNLRWVTHKENLNNNNTRYNQSIKHIGNKGYWEYPIHAINGRKKKVFQYDLDDNLIKEFDSITQASKELKIFNGTITKYCKENKIYKNKFKFKYE